MLFVGYNYQSIKDMKKEKLHTPHNARAIQKRIKVSRRYFLVIKARNRALSSNKPHSSLGAVITLEAPEHICLYKKKNHNKLITFIRQLRKITIKNQTRVAIDFQNTIDCGASGMLLLLSEVDRIKSITQQPRILSAIKVKNDTIRQVLKQTGLGEMLNYHDNINVTLDDVKHWKFVTGVGTEGSIVGELTEQLIPSIGQEISSELYGAFVDAIDNVASHAYTEKRHAKDKFKEKRWWLFAQVIDGRFITAACDLGMGISRSLPSEGFLEDVMDILDKLNLKNSDASYIKAAFELTRTKTKDPKHGKGLKRMRKIVDIIKGSHISIYSNSGLYTYTHGTKGNKTEKLYSTKDIMGTIIEWDVPVNSNLAVS